MKLAEILGKQKCYMYTIEWQKRGLAHAHFLSWLVESITPEQVDSLIRAEIPNETEDKELFEIIKKNMIHGPCGQLNENSPCMHNGKFSKKFPKHFIQETQTDRDQHTIVFIEIL